MKPYVLGKSIFFREVMIEDAEFIIKLRTDPEKSRHISVTSGDIEKQKGFIASYLQSQTEYYFVICDLNRRSIGTIRIYDVRDNSFCWGSWILADDAPRNAAIESALLIYDFAFFSLHYQKSHFDVRKKNIKVVDFHKRFGALIVGEDDLNYYFEYDRATYLNLRPKYQRYLP
ncbi:MAG: GNAT family N-acetyltransferase [Gammaproteobacteria bacterium]|nr:GNAT family N-acetyltransferase [Gammaproteobacteria bacterium]MBU1978064.1 GNAT family N-acetyltransferase [Gammaproteobacteria bacterium]